MAWDDAGDDITEFWSTFERQLWEDAAGGTPFANDETAQFLYDQALFSSNLTHDERAQVYDALLQYVADEYDMDFTELVDWEAYRKWYENL